MQQATESCVAAGPAGQPLGSSAHRSIRASWFCFASAHDWPGVSPPPLKAWGRCQALALPPLWRFLPVFQYFLHNEWRLCKEQIAQSWAKSSLSRRRQGRADLHGVLSFVLMRASSPAHEGREEPPRTEGTIRGDWTLTTPTTKTTCWCRVWPVGTIPSPMLRISFSKVLIWDKERKKPILFCICLYKVLAGTASCDPCFFESNCNIQSLISFKALSL